MIFVIGFVCLFDELFGFEVSSQVENLPDGQAEQTAHTEYAEVENFGVGRLLKNV